MAGPGVDQGRGTRAGDLRSGPYRYLRHQHVHARHSSPFGDLKQSGVGREFAEEGLAEYTELQAVVSAGKLPALDGD